MIVKRHDFIERTLFLLRKLLEEHLPEKAILDEMVDKRDKLLQKFLK